LFHVNPSGLTVGQSLTEGSLLLLSLHRSYSASSSSLSSCGSFVCPLSSGQFLGYHAYADTTSDVAIFVTYSDGSWDLLSYFDYITPELFTSTFLPRNVTSPSEPVLTKAQRDADPLSCSPSGQFLTTGHLPQWIDLSKP
jgi:hypothetical protein